MDSNHRPAVYETAALPSELRWPHPSIAQNQAVDKTGEAEILRPSTEGLRMTGKESETASLPLRCAQSFASVRMTGMTGKENEIDSLTITGNVVDA